MKRTGPGLLNADGQVSRRALHYYLLEVTNPNPNPFFVAFSGMGRDVAGYEQPDSAFILANSGWRHISNKSLTGPYTDVGNYFRNIGVVIRANSTLLVGARTLNECIMSSIDDPVESCEFQNGFWDILESHELFPEYERGLPPNFLMDNWGLENTTDDNWLVKAICNGGEQGIYDTYTRMPPDEPNDLYHQYGNGLVEFPRFSKLPFPTSHVPVDWGEITAGTKQWSAPPAGHHGNYLPFAPRRPYHLDDESDLKWVVWGSCDFFSKKQ